MTGVLKLYVGLIARELELTQVKLVVKNVKITKLINVIIKIL